MLSPKERLLNVLNGRQVDRPPVICTGGMMNAAIVDVMTRTGNTLPEAHFQAGRMSALAGDIHAETGFENLGIPFCMTVEAEVLGSEIDFGSLACEPKIARESFAGTRDVVFKDVKAMLGQGRIGQVAGAAERLARLHPDQPVIGSLTGPISTAASLVDPMQFLKELRKEREQAHRVLEYVSDFLIGFAHVLVESGATAICIGDPTATGEILGPKMFDEYAVKYLNKVIDGIHAAGVPVMVHICGEMKAVKPSIPLLHADAVSTDAFVNLRMLKQEYPQLTTMGNVSTILLESGDPEKVARRTETLVREGIDIISPACGLSTSTSLEAIRAMTSVVKEGAK
ncbi:uroporphyrinogen decarboxylase family protein [Geobacter sp. SVR]|uniref:uroporphyrinogen decarboxylase family protein n=1 Tax=Geobacter sp. SVR TaxID=2495594 RepID=UPI00143F0393|nr:uroporphyrinogen decarboxylase family protein [Geobacter sp. SVR]BCS54148.1 methylcobamide--CoM methyltransferase [Geobacter sp. SVR]GCF87710.1 methylcobamide--CoM methyltransferase [Geobacter sp. SVR]